MDHTVTKFSAKEYPQRNVTPIFNAESTEIVFDLRVFAVSGGFRELVNLDTPISSSEFNFYACLQFIRSRWSFKAAIPRRTEWFYETCALNDSHRQITEHLR
jgi:hypothetical protein